MIFYDVHANVFYKSYLIENNKNISSYHNYDEKH